LYGVTHGSEDADKTLCGRGIDHNWWIVDNAFEGEITCVSCLKVLKRRNCFGWEKIIVDND
jgi:hypothetical protein